MGIARTAWNEKVQTRVGATSNVLAQLKSIKMSGLSSVLSEFLQRLREEEIKASLKERRTRVMLHALCKKRTNLACPCDIFADWPAATTTAVTPVVVIAGGLFWTEADTGLGVAQIFKVLAVVVIISGPLATLLVCIPFFAAGFVCLTRIQDYLLLDEIVDQRIHEHIPAEQDRPGAVELTNVALVGSEKESSVLKNINLRFPVGLVSMVVGPVGCGKSTLLRAILGEVDLQRGYIRFAPENAYCDQTAWIQNISIRDNIIGHKDYNPHWYMSVLCACALDQDVRLLPGRDKTLAGSGGCNLSGGQKQRVVSFGHDQSSPEIQTKYNARHLQERSTAVRIY
jgi:ABC-type bacteriocin/lantibiotic exporter with double-glycine peptidase domain